MLVCSFCAPWRLPLPLSYHSYLRVAEVLGVSEELQRPFSGAGGGHFRQAKVGWSVFWRLETESRRLESHSDQEEDQKCAAFGR